MGSTFSKATVNGNSMIYADNGPNYQKYDATTLNIHIKEVDSVVFS
jgi:hypothetical protein